MDDRTNFILLRSEPEAITMYKDPSLKINNEFLIQDKNIDSNNIYNKISKRNMNKNSTIKIPYHKGIKKDRTLRNFMRSKTQQTLDSNNFMSFKGKTESILMPKKHNMKNDKQVNFNLSNNNSNLKNFYLTSSFNSMHKKNKSQKNISYSTRETNYMIDLIHKKEIKLCLDLIRKLPENGIENKNNIDEKKEGNFKETKNLIGLIKNFNFDNINNQKRIEYQIINDNNNSFDNSNILKSEIIPLDNSLVSNGTALKPKNINDNINNNQNINNLALEKTFNNSSIDIKNNNSNILQNNSNHTNIKLIKSQSTNNLSTKYRGTKSNIFANKMDYFKNEINFHTGFVRSQKNIYNEAFKSFRRKNLLNHKKLKKIKKDKEKLTLPEIEEYKSIIKEIETRKNKQRSKSKDILEDKKDRSELDLKDKLYDELQDIYKDQKSTFLYDLQKNYSGKKNRINYDPIKEEKNANIRNINNNKRKENYFVDGYSLFNGNVNKRLNEFNYILGNKFYDKEQKKEKEEKFYKCIEEFENKLKRYRNDLFNEHKEYKKIFKQNIDFRKDKNKEDYEAKNFEFNKKYLIY